MKRLKGRFFISAFFATIFCSLLLGAIPAHAYNTPATTTADMAQFSGVTVSPTGEAWTTDYKDTTNERNSLGYTITTGVASTLRALSTGEHYYYSTKEDSINVGKWEVTWPDSQCIHDTEWGQSHIGGFPSIDHDCFASYNNGWYAYCADCGELVGEHLFYGKSSTMANITSLAPDSFYVYLCPYCNGIEQTFNIHHQCKKISNNFYTVVYNKNKPANVAAVNGAVPTTKHMYNNADTYNGVPASELGYDSTKLRKNTYTAEGYEFIGWNTKADGTGTPYTDGQEILNLSPDNNGRVTLYAQWKLSENTLNIDPNGGKYNGNAGITSITKNYGETYNANPSGLTAPTGHKITFETNGGNAVSSITTTKSFYEWQKGSDFQGKLVGNIYTFIAEGYHVDTITATYTDDPFILPTATKSGSSFAGWYADKELTEFVGAAGSSLTTDSDITLYAKWAELVLTSLDNYRVYDGSGAVDLSWTKLGSLAKYYKIYQSLDKTSWTQIHSADVITDTVTITKNFNYNTATKTYTVESTGYYELTANGAKGGDYGNYAGGKGGKTTATYWLKKGDIITFYSGTAGSGTSGGVNGSSANGAASSTTNGAGGGAGTEVYITRNGVTELLMVAGGGGGANESFNGGAGGSSQTTVGSQTGQSSEYGGGGGGAQGGSGGGSFTTTTYTDPSTDDVAFISNLSKNLGVDRVEYYNFPQEETPLLTANEGTRQQTWRNIVTLGNLTKSFSTSDTCWYDDDDSDSWHGDITSAAGTIGSVAYIQQQLRCGVTFSLQQTYNTNSNKFLVVGGGLSRDDKGAPGHGTISLTVTNTDTGALLYNAQIYHGYTSTPVGGYGSAGAAFVKEVDVSSATRVTVNVTVGSEGTQEGTAGHLVQAYVSDLYFYGKQIGTAGPTTGGTNYINTGYGCMNPSSIAGSNNGAGSGSLKSGFIGFHEDNYLNDVKATDLEAPDAVELDADENIMKYGEDAVIINWETPEDNGTAYYHQVESYTD